LLFDPSILRSFAVTDQHFVPCEIEILHTETKTLLKPKPATVEQLADGAVFSLKAFKDQTDLLPRQNYRKMLGTFCFDDLLEVDGAGIQD